MHKRLKHLPALFFLSYAIFFATAFFGPAFFARNVGIFTIFPARIMILPVWLLLIACLASGSLSWRQIMDKRVSRYVLVFLVLWFAYACLSLLWVRSFVDGIRDLFNLAMGISLVVPALFLTRERVKLLARVWVAMTVVLVVIGIIEHVTTLHLPISRLFQDTRSWVNFRPTGFFDNENNYASFMTLSIPFVLFLCWNKSLLERVAWHGFIGIMIYLVLATTSRINFLAIYFIVISYTVFLTPPKQRLKTLVTLGLLVAVVSTSMGLVQPALRGVVGERMGSLYDAYNDYLERFKPDYVEAPLPVGETSIGVRINMLKNGLLFFRHTWGFGTGVGNFETWIEGEAIYDTKEYINPHNWWIELLTEYGLIIALGYIFIWLLLMLECFRSFRQAPLNQKQLPGSIFLGLLVMAIVAFSPSSFLTYYPHWLLLAMAAAYASDYNGGEEVL